MGTHGKPVDHCGTSILTVNWICTIRRQHYMYLFKLLSVHKISNTSDVSKIDSTGTSSLILGTLIVSRLEKSFFTVKSCCFIKSPIWKKLILQFGENVYTKAVVFYTNCHHIWSLI
jgi:hypothetical protein